MQSGLFDKKKTAPTKSVQALNQGAKLDTAPAVAQKVNLSNDQKASSIPATIGGKLTSAFYIPVHSNKDDKAVWEEVQTVFDAMPEHDWTPDADKDFDAHSCKYSMNTYMLAHTRLCRVKGDDQLLIELRKLEGNGFTFHDEYKKNLQKKFEQPTAPAEKQDPEFLYLDLSDPSSADMIETWLDDLLPETDLVYNQSRCYSALSTLGWNLKDDSNYKVLSEHREKVIQRTINILRHVDHLATIYFAALCLSQFAARGELGSLPWENLAVISGTIQEWSGDKKGDISRSREVIRLLVNVLSRAETPAKKPTKPIERKMKKLFKPDGLKFAKVEKELAVLKERYSAFMKL